LSRLLRLITDVGLKGRREEEKEKRGKITKTSIQKERGFHIHRGGQRRGNFIKAPADFILQSASIQKLKLIPS